MRIAINKQILENTLSLIQPFLEKKDASLITSHVLLKIDNEKTIIKATDYEIGLEIRIPNNQTVVESGEITVNGKKLLDIIKNLKNDEIIVEKSEDNIIIKQSNSKFKLPSFNSSEFPEFPNYEEKPKIDIDSTKLIQAIKKITPSIDTNNPKYELNGALIDIKDGYINVVSTDTRRLGVNTIYSGNNQPLSIIIPKKAIIEIQKLFSDSVEIYYDEINLIIKSSNYQFFTKLINGKFPDYQRIIPKDSKYTFELQKDRVLDAIRLINAVSNEIKITFEQNRIIFESLNSESSEANTEIEFNYNEYINLSLALNSKYLKDFLSNIDTESFLCVINEPNHPFVVKSENFQTVIMPIIL